MPARLLGDDSSSAIDASARCSVTPEAATPARLVLRSTSTDAKTYRIALPGWEIETGGDHHAFGLRGDARGTTPRDAPLGYEVKVLQSGRLLAHLRLAGVCNSFACAMRTVKVQLP